MTHHATRASLPFALARPLAAHAGVYESPEWGRIEISTADPTLRVTFGVLHTLARPDAVFVELEPGERRELQFEGKGSEPDSLLLEERRFHRTTSPATP